VDGIVDNLIQGFRTLESPLDCLDQRMSAMICALNGIVNTLDFQNALLVVLVIEGSLTDEEDSLFAMADVFRQKR